MAELLKYRPSVFVLFEGKIMCMRQTVSHLFKDKETDLLFRTGLVSACTCECQCSENKHLTLNVLFQKSYH